MEGYKLKNIKALQRPRYCKFSTNLLTFGVVYFTSYYPRKIFVTVQERFSENFKIQTKLPLYIFFKIMNVCYCPRTFDETRHGR